MLNIQDIDTPVDDTVYAPFLPVPATVHQKITAPIPVTRRRLPFVPWRLMLLGTIIITAVPCGIAAAAPVINGADLAVVALLIAFVATFVIPGEDIR